MNIDMPPGLRALRARQQPRNRAWYCIENRAQGDTATVMIYDEIGWPGLEAQEFVRDLDALNVKTINLRVNSPGGSVFDGVAVHNAIKNHPARVVATVDGLAASAASFILMAADEVVVEPNSTLMIHEGQGVVLGDAADMRQTADLLDKLSDTIAGMYAAKTGRAPEEFRALMMAETWFNADEALAAGLADSIAGQEAPAEPADDSTGPSIAFDLSAFKYPGRDAAPAPKLPTASTDAPEPSPASTQEPAAPPPEAVPAPGFVGTQAQIAEGLAAVIADAIPVPVEPGTTDDAEAEPPTTDEDTWGALVAQLTSTIAPLDPVGDALASLREAMQ